ncbi:NADH-ubiquinone oxidoreductase B12 subunit family-domain-containing protein [Lipomyces japonicus]|uniref:NADH-ubiquinone oxidoreductase B12 subunit family-domain-containing protein n=1 Tax=Lipomyces japonicus TaxID=56871 RepID=UPI0034CEE33F
MRPSRYLYSSPAKDPWERREAWRYTGQFSRWNRLKGLFPGLGLGTGAFVLYLVYEKVTEKSH